MSIVQGFASEFAANPAALMKWLTTAASARPVEELCAALAEASLPGPRRIVGPTISGSEGWYWPWNKLGFGRTGSGKPTEAAFVFKVAYLTALKNQLEANERFHKGMPLCNVAYSYNVAGLPLRARFPAALGIVEDSISSGDPWAHKSYGNFLSAGGSPDFADGLARLAIAEVRGRGRTPLYPESILLNLPKTPISPIQILPGLEKTVSEFTPSSVTASVALLDNLWAQMGKGIEDESVRSNAAQFAPSGSGSSSSA
jgi:hypothetical protein